MQLYFCNGGGSSPYDRIALNLGFRLGLNSAYFTPKRSYDQIDMVDNDWQNYDHEHHLHVIKKFRPQIATARDLEDISQFNETISQICEISQFADRVIFIPKCALNTNQIREINQIECLLIGLPVGRFSETFWRKIIDETDLSIHLLGGSPKLILKEWQRLKNRVVSCDSNYLSRIAGYGKIATFRDRKPLSIEVPSGPDFNYRCFEVSAKYFFDFWRSPQDTQLQLNLEV